MRHKVGMFIVMLMTVTCIYGQNCNANNKTKGPYVYSNADPLSKQHAWGNHDWANVTGGTCSYTGVAQQGVSTPCAVHSTARSNSTSADYGTTAPWFHAVAANDAQGLADGPDGGTAASDSEGAMGANSCFGIPCGVPTVNITGSGQGGGFSVGYGASNLIWQDKVHYTNTCTAYTLPPVNCSVPNPPTPPKYPVLLSGSGDGWVWNIVDCQWEIECDPDDPSCGSPVVIDTKGNWGKAELFTDPTRGEYVSFDLQGNGTVQKFSWPKHESGLAWLALDRDGDGVIKDGQELFGNYTPHSSPAGYANYPNPNGFVALSWYDSPAQGGDGNLILDHRDAIWSKLRLWIDEHCYKAPDTPCQSLPEELHSLESMGVTSISLVWDVSTKTDAVGNQFRFDTVINPEAELTPVDERGHSCCDLHQKGRDGRLAYDVFLKTVN